MTRKKVKLAYIVNDSARKATFKKRKKGLMKKVSELSTLCGIDACAIIYSPYEAQPEVWPDPAGVQRVISRFRRMPEVEQSKKMVNQEGFIRQRIDKSREQVKKLHRENREKEITEVMFQCLTAGKSVQGMPMPDLKDIGWWLDQKLKGIYKRIETLKNSASQPPPAPPVALSAQALIVSLPVPALMAPSGGSSTSSTSMQVQGGHQHGPSLDLALVGTHMNQWFGDWMNNPNDQNMGFGNNNGEGMWNGPFFP